MSGLFTLFAAGCAEKSFFGLLPWYHYLNQAGKMDSSCSVTSFQVLGRGSDVVLVLLAVIDDLLRLAGLIAVGFVIYAGVKYVTSQGSPDETSKAQSTLMNAIIGLAVALVAVAFVSFIGNQVAGSVSAPSTNPGVVDVSGLPKTSATASTIKTVLTIVFGILGALSLLFITIGGFRYVISQGDPQAVTKAKNTILYAVIGLVVAITAQAIVTFVIGRL